MTTMVESKIYHFLTKFGWWCLDMFRADGAHPQLDGGDLGDFIADSHQDSNRKILNWP